MAVNASVPSATGVLYLSALRDDISSHVENSRNEEIISVSKERQQASRKQAEMCSKGL